jgi:hypothetical protein
MHFRVVVSVSGGLYLTVMTDRDSHCSQLPSTQVRSFDYLDDSSQAMPRIFCKLYFLSSRRSALALRAICAKVSKAPNMWLKSEEEAWGTQGRQISNTMLCPNELPS